MNEVACQRKTSPVGLRDRVRELLESRALTQAALAERAKLSPAMLSRILSAERAVRMEHLVALASALGVTVAELVSGTSAASVVEEWVPSELLDACQQALARGEHELTVLRAEVRARAAEADTLRNQLAEAEGRVLAARAEALRRGAELAEVPHLREELAEARAAAAGARAERNRLVAEGAALRDALEREQGRSSTDRALLESARERIARLQHDLASTRGASIAVGAMSASLSAILGAIGAVES